MQPPRNISMSITVLAVIGLLSTPLKTQAGDEGPTGSIVGWGSQVVGVDLSGPFDAVAAGGWHSLGLKSDGSIVAWGHNGSGETSVPAPNADFIAVAAGYFRSLGIKALRADLNLDGRVDSADHVGMVACLAGPGVLPLGCNLAKLNGDSWVDLRDYAAFQSRVGAPFP